MRFMLVRFWGNAWGSPLNEVLLWLSLLCVSARVQSSLSGLLLLSGLGGLPSALAILVPVLGLLTRSLSLFSFRTTVIPTTVYWTFLYDIFPA